MSWLRKLQIKITRHASNILLPNNDFNLWWKLDWIALDLNLSLFPTNQFFLFFSKQFLWLLCTNAQMKSQIRRLPFFHVGRVLSSPFLDMPIDFKVEVIFAWSRHLFVSLLYSHVPHLLTPLLFSSPLQLQYSRLR